MPTRVIQGSDRIDDREQWPLESRARDGAMTQHILRAGKISLGVLLLILGVIGLALPVIPQVPFFIGGLTLLSSENRHAKALLEYVENKIGWRRHPKPDEPRSNPQETRITDGG